VHADGEARSSSASIGRAARTGGATTIEAELERAELLACSACINTVMALLDHPDYAVREVAAWWFARRPALAREITDRARASLAGDDDVAARNAADVLGALEHPAAIPALAGAIGRMDRGAEVRAAAARALGRIGHPDGIPALARALEDPDASVRARAIDAWHRIRGQIDAAPIAPLVSDPDATVRRLATAVVGDLRAAAARVALEQRLASDPDAAVRRNAAWALGRLGDPASRPALEAATSDPSGLVRMVARAAVGQLR